MSCFVIRDPNTEISDTDINLSSSDSIGMLRTNNAGDKAIIEFQETDDLARDNFKEDKWYSNKKILKELEKAEWTPSL